MSNIPVGQIIGTGLNIAAASADERRRRDLLKQGRADLSGAEIAYGKSMKDLASQQYKVGQRERDLAMAMRGVTADTSGAAADLATSLDYMDPRSMQANIPELQRSARQARQDQFAQQREADIQSTGYLAGAEKAARDANLGLRRQEGMMESQFALENLRTAGANVAGLEAQNPWADALANTAQLWAGYTPSFGEKDDTAPKSKNGGRLDVISQILANGGKPVVQKLHGPEDHDRKKFAIMESGAVLDEDNGEKVAEATGQEYILNSKQASGIHEGYEMIEKKMKSGERVSESDWIAFYEAVKEVFSQPQFNEE